nr:DciA family protein [Streptomyces sp. V1I1]
MAPTRRSAPDDLPERHPFESVLDQWPAIAAPVSPQLPKHAQAVAFHAEKGRLDLRPDSPAYATQLRLITSRIVRAANDVAGSEAVRTVRVLPVGSIAPASSTAAAEPVAAGPPNGGAVRRSRWPRHCA